ncbi:finger 345 isoform X1 [Octopus vulgaris]|uniref:Finger 345 isoform X1 n=2 Tax=Octopus TaxID=6643 RepID=A0AA36F1T0_OCTVU|nr:zinc finger protein 345 isoform X1 [Octopus sinensis]XP_036359268.1 zinc finger protein 345 isoform X1 [Octopus sinensis]CAI9722481.1 finger 345 isoform X1 [Octopus vulgaris]
MAKHSSRKASKQRNTNVDYVLPPTRGESIHPSPPSALDTSMHQKTSASHSVPNMSSLSLGEATIQDKISSLPKNKLMIKVKEELECSECQKTFTQRKLLKEHMKTHVSEKSNECLICNKAFKSLGELTKHLKTHSKGNSSKKNSDFTQFLSTILSQGLNSFECPICLKGFSQASSLTTHLKVHTGEHNFQCHICKKTFMQSSHLAGHLKVHTGEKPYTCDYCKKQFAHSGNLTKHLRVHTGERPFKCDRCPKSFSQSNSLAVHLRIHTGEKPFKCNHCEKSFSRANYLAIHMTVHTGDKNFQCRLCNKLFAQSCHLTEHFKIHTGEKPFKCKYCQKDFAQSGNLTKHLRVHTGEKPYRCPQCSKAFSQSNSLTAHLRIHSGEKPYECKYCLKLFSRSGYLRAHLKIHVAEGLLPASALESSRSQQAAAISYDVPLLQQDYNQEPQQTLRSKQKMSRGRGKGRGRGRGSGRGRSRGRAVKSGSTRKQAKPLPADDIQDVEQVTHRQQQNNNGYTKRNVNVIYPATQSSSSVVKEEIMEMEGEGDQSPNRSVSSYDGSSCSVGQNSVDDASREGSVYSEASHGSYDDDQGNEDDGREMEVVSGEEEYEEEEEEDDGQVEGGDEEADQEDEEEEGNSASDISDNGSEEEADQRAPHIASVIRRGRKGSRFVEKRPTLSDYYRQAVDKQAVPKHQISQHGAVCMEPARSKMQAFGHPVDPNHSATRGPELLKPTPLNAPKKRGYRR